MFMTEEIVSILILYVRDIASNGLPKDKVKKLKKTKYGMIYGQVSLAAAMTRVKLATSLGRADPRPRPKAPQQITNFPTKKRPHLP